MNILVAMEVTGVQRTWLEKAAGDNPICFLSAENAIKQEPPVYEVAEEKLADADVIIGNVSPASLAKCKHLKWLQLDSAGANAYIVPGALPEGAVLTNATGAYGPAMAEHMLGALLAMMKKFYLYYDNQKRIDWHDEGPVHTIEGARAVIIGFGDIGRHFGRLLKAMGAHVMGIRRRSTDVPPEADAMGTMDKIDEYLKDADIVATCLPETPATHHFFTKDRFDAMKEGAWFINVGRGTAVVQEDLQAALESGHLAGASVDVTDPEPLPADHPLWRTKNMYITPHVSGGNHVAATFDRIVSIAVRNLQHIQKGEPLENVVDMETGYKK